MPNNCIDCVVCGQPIPLEVAKTQDDGFPVHEECYLLSVRLKQASMPPTKEIPMMRRKATAQS